VVNGYGRMTIKKVIIYTFNEEEGKTYKVELTNTEYWFCNCYCKDYNALFAFLDYVIKRWEEVKDA